MILADVNVLVHAHREDSPDHSRYLKWLTDIFAGSEPSGVNDHILSGLPRIVTHPRVFSNPTPLDAALRFVKEIRGAPAAVAVQPGPRFWSTFEELCRSSGARGNLIPDAYFTALAIELGSRWFSSDRDYARFRGLDWTHPLDT